MNTSTRQWRTPAVVIVAGCLISLIGFGIRSSFGLFLEPMTTAQGWTRETFGLAMALQNLFWGLGLPVAGILADKWGSSRVIIGGAIAYFAGVYGMAVSDTQALLYLTGGVLSGLGIAFSAFTLAMASMVRVVGPEKRSFVLGVGTAAGSAGQVLFSPIGQGFINSSGWQQALIMLSVFALILIPLAWMLPHGAPGNPTQDEQTLPAALSEALSHRGFILLTLGFFVCGFHVAFITVHFPAYVQDIGLNPDIGAYSLALIGLFNIGGSLLSGIAGQRYSMKFSLSFIYMARAIAITALLILPKTPLVVLGFAAVMGLLWLSTVPLTTGIIAQVFGTRYMGTLFGLVFLSHQVGSFSGVWLGGKLYDSSGSYDSMWIAGIVLGLLAAILHLPINELPLARLTRSESMQPQVVLKP